MGAIADAIVAYAQPLLDQTDGAVDKMNRAMTIAQMCWNLAILPEERRDAAIDKLRPALKMTDGEFAEFRQHVVLPMIQRHREMFPQMHVRSKQDPRRSASCLRRRRSTQERVGMLFVRAGVDANTSGVAACGNDLMGETFIGR